MNKYTLTILLTAIAPIFWGGMFAVSKDALLHIDSYHLSLYRYGGASIIFAIILFLKEGKQAFIAPRKEILQATLFGTIGFLGYNFLVWYGMSFSTAITGAIIMSLQPMMGVLVSWIFFKKKPLTPTIFAVIVSFIGVFLVVTDGKLESLMGMNFWGSILIMIGALSWVIYGFGLNYLTPKWSPLRYTSLTCILGSLMMLICVVIMTMAGIITTPSRDTVELLFWHFSYLIILAGVISVILWNRGLKSLGTVNGLLFMNIVPITALIIGVVIGSSISIFQIIGALLSMGSLVFNYWYITQYNKKTN